MRRGLLALVMGMVALGAVTLYSLSWDPRLNDLNVTWHPAADCSAGCWRLVEARYEDDQESGGMHHIWARAQSQDGWLMEGQPWHVAWPEGDQRLVTKGPSEWADFPMFAGYDPFQGEAGPYRAWMGDEEARSDVVAGMGLPLKHHVNFRLTWRWQPHDESPTVTPVASSTPGAQLPNCLYLPQMSK